MLTHLRKRQIRRLVRMAIFTALVVLLFKRLLYPTPTSDTTELDEGIYNEQRSIRAPSAAELSVQMPDDHQPHFIYYALHKTGSSQLRMPLREFCICCRGPFVESLEGGLQFDGIVDHFHLGTRADQQFLRRHTFEDSYTFTMMRNPYNQFFSYYHFVKMVPFYKNFTGLPSIEEFVDFAYDRLILSKNVTSSAFNFELASSMLLNSQAKELGFIENEGNLEEIVNTITHVVDFVMLSEYSKSGMEKLFKEGLRWPGYFEWHWANDDNGAARSYTSLIGDRTMRRLHALLHADLTLYRVARQRFLRAVAGAQQRNAALDTWRDDELRGGRAS